MAGKDEIRYVIKVTRPRWMVWANHIVAVIAGCVLMLIIVRGWPARATVFPGLLLALYLIGCWLRLRSPTVTVTRAGIHLPLRRRDIGWDEVAVVLRPGPFSETVMLKMASGREQRVPIPPEYSERVAAIGEIAFGPT